MPGTLLEEIAQGSGIWAPDLDISLPIDDRKLPGSVGWIDWNGYSPEHTAFDFAAYLMREHGRFLGVLGLPAETCVRSIADGTVSEVYVPKKDLYYTHISVGHDKLGTGLHSIYGHVKPRVRRGQVVEKGEPIATLYKDDGNEEGKLVHLHFELANGWEVTNSEPIPSEIFPSIGRLKAEPQGNPDFQIPGFPLAGTRLANFKCVYVNGFKAYSQK